MSALSQRTDLLPRANATSAGPVTTHAGDGIQINNTISAGSGHTQHNALNQYFQNSANADEDQLDAQFRRSLCSSCPQVDRTDLIDTKGEAVGGTREWVLETAEYRSWLQNDSSPLLWIWGGPGKGKTMLSIFLSQELEKNNKTLYFFCSAKDEKHSTAVGVLRGLIWHLTSLYPQLTKVLRKKLDSTTESAFSSRDTLWEAFEGLLREREFERLYCIIDGLDECDKSSQHWLTKKLEFSNTHSVANRPKLIVASRELLGFKDAIQLKLDSDYREQVNSSVEAFVGNTIEILFDRLTLNETLRQEVKDKLLRRAQGTYLYVGFAAIELARQATTNGILNTLEELPAGLSPLYSRLLSNIEPSQQRLISRILGFVSLARRPLSLEELVFATGCRPMTGALDPKQNVRDLIKGFGPLFRILDNRQLIRCYDCRHCLQVPTDPDEKRCPVCRSSYFVYVYDFHANSRPGLMSDLKQTLPTSVETVDLVHESVRDFLKEATLPDGTRFTPDEVHFQFARACIDGLVSNEALESSFASYAADYWPIHARNSGIHAKKLLSHPSLFFDKKSTLRAVWWRRGGHEKIPRLHMACLLGYAAWVESILSSWEAKLSNVLLLAKKDVNGFTPLHAAVKSGDEKTVGLLLQHTSIIRAFIDIVHDNDTALYMAASRGNREIAQLLLHHKADPNIECRGDTSLKIAVRHGYVDVVELLLLHKANVNAKSGVFRGGTALHDSAAWGHADVAAILLRHGADVDAKRHEWSGRHGRNAITETALHIAANDGHEAVARLLLQHKTDFTLVSSHGETVLHMAARSGNEAVLKLFLGKVDVDVMSTTGTALQVAASYGHTGVVKLLLEHGADVNARTDSLYFGLTALQSAAENGQLATVTVLLGHSADVSTLR